ncbi:MAG TPA: carboxymuconolactone decarboxylase family protein [Candidatus Thermoplasmatota archaeon]|nr:carboxymuconolactone decarboxylase family protein [Candidatus Thermoplasmatota archaeon]
MRLLEEWFPEFAMILKGWSSPCFRKHFKGALEDGAILKKLAYIMALVFRESAGNDDCGVHDILADYQELMMSNMQCC